MTLEQIYSDYRTIDQNYKVFCTLKEGIETGYSVEQIRNYLESRGYNRNYLNEMIEAMRQKSIIPPWD